MKILHVIPSLDPSQGGPSTAMPQIAKALTQQGVTVDVACVDPVPQTSREGAWVEHSAAGYRTLTFPPLLLRYRASLAFLRWITRHVCDYDLIHVHGVLNLPCLAAERAAVSQGVPLVVRPLGILNRWGMERRKPLLKTLWFRFLEKPLLDQAAAMHFTSQEEHEDVSRLGITAPARVLPLGMDMTPFENLPSGADFRRSLGISSSEKLLLFLSRIHPKKGLELLFDAFSRLRRQRQDVRLVVAGDGEPDYLAKLHSLAVTLDIDGSVHWTGFLDASQRMKALAAADLFCLPSSSENFGIALLEAMAAGIPCVSSPEVALAREPVTQGAVEVVQRDPALWYGAMDALLSQPQRARALADRAIQVCREHYSTEKLGTNLVQLYSGLLKRRPLAAQPRHESAPDTVRDGSFLDRITPVILTWNEEPNLARCLCRLTWAGQVIVLDSGSTDATAAIAASHPNVRFLHRPFDNHTAQWNYALDQATTEWVLSLDADYVLAAGFEEELAALRPSKQTLAYQARFRYCVHGRPLRGSLYPPRAVLFRRAHCRYVQDGHTQMLAVHGDLNELRTPILHDDRKSLSRWFASQDKYAELEADKLLAADRSSLRPQDRARLTGWAAVPATFFYVLLVNGALLDGWRGWFYTLQRTLAEAMLALRLIEKRLGFDRPTLFSE